MRKLAEGKDLPARTPRQLGTPFISTLFSAVTLIVFYSESKTMVGFFPDKTWPFLVWRPSTLLDGIQEHPLQSSGFPHECTQWFASSKKDPRWRTSPLSIQIKVPKDALQYLAVQFRLETHSLLKLVSKEIRKATWIWRFFMNVCVIL